MPVGIGDNGAVPTSMINLRSSQGSSYPWLNAVAAAAAAAGSSLPVYPMVHHHHQQQQQQQAQQQQQPQQPSAGGAGVASPYFNFSNIGSINLNGGVVGMPTTNRPRARRGQFIISTDLRRCCLLPCHHKAELRNIPLKAHLLQGKKLNLKEIES